MAKCLCSVSKPWFFILLLFLYSVQKRIDTQKNESERARKAFCYCFSFLSILNLHVYINLNFTRLRFEFDITWLNVCVLKTLNFWLLIFLLFCLEKRINVPKKPKNNENERAGTRNEPLRSSTWEAKVKQERFEKDAPNTFTENKSMSKHRYAIYQIHHLKSKTKIMHLWIGQRSCEFRSIVSQHNKLELQPGGSPLFSKTHFHSTIKQASQQQLDCCNSFQYGK